MRAVAGRVGTLIAWATLAVACGPTDAVLGWRDAAAGPLPCGQRVVVAEGDSLSLDVAQAGDGAALVFFTDGTDRLLATVRVADATAAVEPVVGREIAIAPSLPRPEVMVFQNHRLVGQHAIYASAFDPADPGIAWSDVTRISNPEQESLRPRATRNGDRIAVAFRQGDATRLAMLDAETRALLGVRSLAPRLPNPGTRDLVPDGTGFLLAVERNDWELERFDAEGVHLGPGDRIAAATVALGTTAAGATLALIADESGAARLQPLVDGAAAGDATAWSAERPIVAVDLSEGGATLVGTLLDDGGRLVAASWGAEGTLLDRAAVTGTGEVAIEATTTLVDGVPVTFWTRAAPSPAILATLGCVR